MRVVFNFFFLNIFWTFSVHILSVTKKGILLSSTVFVYLIVSTLSFVSFCFRYFVVLVLCTYTFRIILFSKWTVPFSYYEMVPIISDNISCSVFEFDKNIGISAFLIFQFAWYVCFLLLTHFHIFAWDSCRQHIFSLDFYLSFNWSFHTTYI